MASKSKKKDIDSALTFLLLKKLMTPITSFPAYKAGLIDSAGRTIKEAVGEGEKANFTLLDQLVIKIKRLLGTRLQSLYNFIYLQTQSIDLYNSLVLMGNVQQRSEIKRIQSTMKNLMESAGMTTEDLVYNLLLEDLLQDHENNLLMEDTNE